MADNYFVTSERTELQRGLVRSVLAGVLCKSVGCPSRTVFLNLFWFMAPLMVIEQFGGIPSYNLIINRLQVHKLVWPLDPFGLFILHCWILKDLKTNISWIFKDCLKNYQTRLIRVLTKKIDLQLYPNTEIWINEQMK